MVQDQVHSIESLVTNIELIAYQLTTVSGSPFFSSSSGQRPTPVFQQHSPLSTSSTHSHSPFVSNNGERGGGNGGAGRDLIDFESAHNPNQSNVRNNTNHGNGSNKCTPLTEALVVIHTLQHDIQGLQMGITMLTLSVQKLFDIVVTNPTPGCCTSTFMWLGLAGSNPSLEGTSTHSTLSINRNVSGTYTSTSSTSNSSSYVNPNVGFAKRPASLANNGTKRASTNTSTTSNNARRGSITLPKAPSIDRIFNRAKQQGYESVLDDSFSTHDQYTPPAISKGQPQGKDQKGYFSIAGPDDDDEDVIVHGFK